MSQIYFQITLVSAWRPLYSGLSWISKLWMRGYRRLLHHSFRALRPLYAALRVQLPKNDGSRYQILCTHQVLSDLMPPYFGIWTLWLPCAGLEPWGQPTCRCCDIGSFFFAAVTQERHRPMQGRPESKDQNYTGDQAKDHTVVLHR